MTLQLSYEQARRFLATYHFTQTDLPGVFERLGTVQYDPLNPVGRNPDLVFQARVPGYRVNDWQIAAYTERMLYDAWDKQACLVPMSDWPQRALTRERYRPYHDVEVLQNNAEATTKVLATIDAQGPLSSLEFENRVRMADNDSWYGLTLTKRILRALWACGLLVTHHRRGGRHYYDRPERVISPRYYNAPPLVDEGAYHRWIILRRIQAMGLARPTGDASVWSACGDGPTRKRALTQLVEEGTLMPVQVGEQKTWTYYMLTRALPLLDMALLPRRAIFLGPLDSLLWDRKAVQHLFDFDYLWEVYKPAGQRRWGYYVLPVFYGDRFIARLDSRMDGGIWTLTRWWWEPDILLNDELIYALQTTIRAFLAYVRASDVYVEEGVDRIVRDTVM